jgi:3-hydroxybutyryl-CoA dehydrogenase
VATIGGSLDRLVKKEKMSAADRDAVLKRVNGTTDKSKLSSCDLVIEAATENEDLKIKILKDLCANLQPHALVATNTSSISVTRLAAATDRPDRFIGMHFFNPVPVMQLVELIRGLQTSDDTHAKALAFAQRVGKVAVTAKNSPGFAVNRILCPMINEAIFALRKASPLAEEIDAGMKLGCNHPIGPLALADMIGLDTMLSVMEVFYTGFNDPKYRLRRCSRKWSMPVILAARPARVSIATRRPEDRRARPAASVYGRMKAKSVSGSQLSARKRNSDWTSATPRVSRYLLTTRPSRARQMLSVSCPEAAASAMAAAK